MATARATLEVRAVAQDRMSGPLVASVDRLRDRMNRFGTSITNSLNVLKAFFAVKIAGKAVDFVEKYSSGEAQQKFLASQKALSDTFTKLGGLLANELAPGLTKIFDGMRVWAEEWGPALVKVMGEVLKTVAQWTSNIIQGLGLTRNTIFELAERSQFLPLMGAKSVAINQMTQQHYDFMIENRRRRGLPEADSERQNELLSSSRALAARDFAAGRTTANIPLVGDSSISGSKTDAQVKKQLSLAEMLAERWTLTSDVVNTELFRTIVNIEDGLVNALTDVVMGTKKASDAFKDFAQAVLQQVIRMFIESGVRGLLGTITGLGGFGGGEGAQGFGGGGGGNTTNIFNIKAIDTQSFAVAAVRADRGTRYLGNLMQANLIRRPDVRQRAGRRR